MVEFRPDIRYTDREMIKISSEKVRFPHEVVTELNEGNPVSVTRYGKPAHVLLSQQQFALVAPFLELLQEGVMISPEFRMTKDDIALDRELASDREPSEGEEDQIAELLSELSE